MKQQQQPQRRRQQQQLWKCIFNNKKILAMSMIYTTVVGISSSSLLLLSSSLSKSSRSSKNVVVTAFRSISTTTTTKTTRITGSSCRYNQAKALSLVPAFQQQRWNDNIRYYNNRFVQRSSLLSSSSSDTTTTTTNNDGAVTEPNGSNDEVVWTTDQVRATFIEYFVTKQHHTYYPSSACVPLNDPTLLFTNAGMNQFKPIFLGQIDPASPMASFERVVNSQKCIRAGGKHNDLEDVGRDTYHHTFFEMLGTWSFGNYFKKEAIDFAWDILTNTYQLNPERLYATYFEGDPVNNIPADEEARTYWLQYLPSERILACPAKDNFWEMGDTGPCGPCTEIHYDRIGNRNAAHLVNNDDPNVIEIWNIVFIQYNRQDPTTLNPLPAKHIDTGMGLERLVSILQNKYSNYDIDCFQPIFQHIETFTKLGPYTGKLGTDDNTLKDTAYRAIADHIRTLSFAIADGATPSNEGRGYVLRRIFRRAARYGQQILGCPVGFFSQLVPTVVETFGPTYPELVAAQETIIELLQEEEQSFSTMLQRGIKYFNEELQDATVISGTDAFFLYDTLGFPIDLTELMANEAGKTVDSIGFYTALEQQKERSRQAQRRAKAAAAGNSGISLELIAEQTVALSKQGILPTDDSFKYENENEVQAGGLPATVLAIFDGTNFVPVDTTIPANQYVGLILDKSPFYSEAGGQEADTGSIDIVDPTTNAVIGTFDVTDVQVYGGYVIHKGMIVTDDDTENSAATISVGQIVNCRVDYNRRKLIIPNHSMTHVLNAALRSVLGNKVDQRGSSCNVEKLRFDFSHKSALTVSELQQVEEICQAVIAQQQPVTTQYLPLKDAMEINGVRAVFGEVYPDPVRVVTIGTDTSIEFCGGTHLRNTADAEAFVLVEETAVAKGIRRITAVTKDTAKDALKTGEEFINRVTELEQLPAETVDLDKSAGLIRKELDAATISAPLKVQLRARIEGVQKKAADATKKALQQRVDLCINIVKERLVTAVEQQEQVVVLNVDIGADAKASQTVLNTVKSLAPDIAFIGISEEVVGSGGKVLVFANVPESKETIIKANEWIQSTVTPYGGRGGGKSTNAQGQIPSCTDIDAVLTTARQYATKQFDAITSSS